MARMLKKFIRPDAIDGSKIKLLNDEALRASSASGMSAISILKVNASDVPEFLTLPIATQDPTDAQHLARKGYVDQKIADLIGAAPALLDTLQELAAALGNDENFATSIAGQISALDARLDVLEGGVSVEGSVAKAAKDALDAAKSYTDQEVALDRQRLTALENSTADQDALNALEGRVSTAEGEIDALQGDVATLKGDVNTAGSVAKAAKDAEDAAKSYADGLASGLDSRLDTLEGDATVSGSVAKAAADAQAAAQTYADGLNTAMDTRVAAIEALSFHKQKVTLGLADVMAGYVDLAHEAVANSTFIFVQGGGYLYEGDDYTVSTVSGVSRITLTGEFASGGVTAIEDGDVLAVQFQYSSGAGGGGNSGGGGGGGSQSIQIMSATAMAEIFYVYWNSSNVGAKYVMLQKYNGGVATNVMGLGLAQSGYGSVMTALLSDGDTIRLKLYDEAMYMAPTTPEVVSATTVVSISSGGGGGGPTSITIGMPAYGIMGSNATVNWSTSNAAGYPYAALFEASGVVPLQSFVKVQQLNASSSNFGIVALSALDPAKSYVVGLQLQEADNTPSYWTGTFQVAEGTGGVSAVHSFNSVTVSSDNTTISWSVTGPTSGTVVGGGSSEVYVVLQKLENGNWAPVSYGNLGLMSAGSATKDLTNTYDVVDLLTPGTYRLKLIGDGGWYFEADGGYVYSEQFLVSEPVVPVVNSASFSDFNTFMGNDTVTVTWSATNVTSVQQALLQSYSAISDSWTEVGILGDADFGTGVISVSGLTGGAQYRVVVVPTFMDHTPLGTASSSITFTAPAKLTYVSTSQSGSSQVFNWSQSGAGSLYVGLEHEVGPAIYGSPVILGLASLGTASVNIADLVDETNYRLALYSDSAGTMPVTSASVTVNGGKTQAFLVDFSVPATITYVSNSASGSNQVINWTAANAAGLYVGLINVATSTKTMLGSESDGTESVSQSFLTNGGSYVLRLFSDAGGNVAVDGSDTAQFTVSWVIPSTLTYEGFGNTSYWDLDLYAGGFVRSAKFAATANQKLDKVSVNLRYKTPASGASVQLTLHTKSGSFLSAPIATSASVPTSSMVLSNTNIFGSHTGSYVDFEFDENQAPLQSGVTYYVKITANQSGENIFAAWYANSDLPSNLVSQTKVYFVDLNGANAVYNDNGHTLAIKIYTKPA